MRQQFHKCSASVACMGEFQIGRHSSRKAALSLDRALPQCTEVSEVKWKKVASVHPVESQYITPSKEQHTDSKAWWWQHPVGVFSAAEAGTLVRREGRALDEGSPSSMTVI